MKLPIMTASRPGCCIESLRDEHGLIEVYESVDAIRLHFGDAVTQSQLFKFAPDVLALSYYRALACSLALIPEPARITLLGLGGGVLARYILSQTSAQLTVVELREALLPIAERHFGVPLASSRVKRLVGDAREKINNVEAGQDIILMDLFDPQGMVMFETEFYAAIRDRLSPQGVFAANLWRTRLAAFAQQCANISKSFPERPLALHLPDRDNSVLIFGHENLRGQRYAQAERQRRELPTFIRAPVDEMWPLIR